MADPSPLLAGRDPADLLSVWTAGSGKGRKTQCGVESEGSLERGRSGIDSVNESLVQGLEGDGHPLERGCPTGKFFGQNRAGEGDGERNGDDELLHRGSPKSVRSIRCPSGLARIALRTRVRWTRRAHFPNSEWL